MKKEWFSVHYNCSALSTFLDREGFAEGQPFGKAAVSKDLGKYYPWVSVARVRARARVCVYVCVCVCVCVCV